jgi:hypothetical protein
VEVVLCEAVLCEVVLCEAVLCEVVLCELENVGAWRGGLAVYVLDIGVGQVTSELHNCWRFGRRAMPKRQRR